MLVKTLVEDCEDWCPTRYHRVSGAQGHVWKTTAQGVLVKGEGSTRRTRGEPTTLRGIQDRFGALMDQIFFDTGVPIQLLAATMANESGGHDGGERFEKHLNDWSIGVMQTLTNTAWGVARSATHFNLKHVAQMTPIPKGGNLQDWRLTLHNSTTSLLLGAEMLRQINERFSCYWDPVLLYAAYNAGSPRKNDDRPWGLHYHRVELKDRVFDAMDTFTAWFGDACAVWPPSSDTWKK